MEDGLVGRLDGGVETILGTGGGARRGTADGRGLGDLREEGVGGEMAGDFAARGSAHAIAYDEGTNGGIGSACVLVAATNLAAVGEHSVDEFDGCQL